MRRTLLRAVKVVSIWIILSLLAIEGLLRGADPLGVLRVTYDLSALWRHLEDDARGYRIRPGEYTLSNWHATILPDGTRAVPDTTAGKRRLVVVGDSFTFGLGVSDSETWVNLLAKDMPGWTVVNAGMPAYNIDNARRSIAAYPAERYIYLLYGNDDEAAFDWLHAYEDMNRYSAMSIYWWWLKEGSKRGHDGPQTPTWYYDSLAAIAGNERVAIVGFAGQPLAEAAKKRYPERVTLIPEVTHRISFADGHPNAAGHRDIAAALALVTARR